MERLWCCHVLQTGWVCVNQVSLQLASVTRLYEVCHVFLHSLPIITKSQQQLVESLLPWCSPHFSEWASFITVCDLAKLRHLKGSPWNPFQNNMPPSTKYLVANFFNRTAAWLVYGRMFSMRYSRKGVRQSLETNVT